MRCHSKTRAVLGDATSGAVARGSTHIGVAAEATSLVRPSGSHIELIAQA
ncbi:MAG: hypothetical protein ACHQQP_05580 [Gemmatimonadales bacterium]